MGGLVALQAFFELEKIVHQLYEESGEPPEDRDPFEITYFSLVVVTFAIGVMGDRKKYPDLPDIADKWSLEQLKRMKKGGAPGNIVERFRKRFEEYSPLLQLDSANAPMSRNVEEVAKVLNRHVGEHMCAPGIQYKHLQTAYRRAASIVSGAFR